MTHSGHWDAFAEQGITGHPTGFVDLLRLDIRELHHLGPLLCFVADELAKVLAQAWKWADAQFDEPRVEFGGGEAGVDLLVEFFDNCSRCVSGCGDAIPAARLIAWQKLGHGRNIRKHGRALCCRYCKTAKLSGSDILT